MAKVILEFDPIEERDDMECAINGWKWKMVAWNFDQHLRNELKYNDHNLTKEQYDLLDKTREALRGMISEEGLIFD